MATLSLTVSSVVKSSGKVYVRWSDGVEQEFASLAAAKEFVDAAVDENTLRALAVSRYLQLDPTAANPSLIEGKTISFSNESNMMVSVA